ncbi:hypothetical protein [Pelagibius sp. Alg239-R121]|uniref:hypothetical protein n=1 Tax=Pelagibius sp. Alg239-R121 TaxID=2993448 RepID=UPI0024A66B76|nr:hypothetical protein [Pelagibius sp. Alg239-R121]
MVQTNKVVRSINMQGEQICVDVFRRPDGTYGFDEFRRDPEDNRGWYAIGHYGNRVFDSFESTLNEARKTVRWLGEMSG